MNIQEIFIRKYNPDNKEYQLTDDSIDFPHPNTLKNALDALALIFQEKTQILKLNNKVATNIESPIDEYLWMEKQTGKYFLTVKFIKSTESENIKCWTLFMTPSSKFQNKFLMVPLNLKLKYNELLQVLATVIDENIKNFEFKIPKSNLQILVQTTNSGQKLIPLVYNQNETLKKFISEKGDITKLQVKVLANLIIQYQSRYTFKIPVSKTIRDVFDLLSQTELTFTSDNFVISLRSEGKQTLLTLNTQLFECFNGEIIHLNLVQTRNSYQFLGFDEPIQEAIKNPLDENMLTSFVSWYKKDENLLRLIKTNPKIFSEEWRKLTFDGFKRGFSGKNSMKLQSMQSKLAEEINNFSLWNNPQLGNNFINYYFIQRCKSFAKIIMGEMLRDNFALPTHVFQDKNRKFQIVEENIFLTSPGITIMSIQLSPPQKKMKCLGKSTLLNQIFYTAFSSQQNRHPTLNSIPEVMFEFFKNTFPFNIIDIPKLVDPQEEKRLLRGANIIILNSWQDAKKTQQKVNELVNTYNSYVLVLQRDRKNSTTKIEYSYKLQQQSKNILQVHNLKQNNDSILNMDILRKLIGTFILQVSKRIKEEDHSKIYKIYDGTKYIDKFKEFTLIMNQMVKNITKLQIKKNQPLHHLFQKMLSFIFNLADLDEQKKFAYLFINMLKKMKSYTQKPYLGLYSIKSDLGKNSDLFNDKDNRDKYEKFIEQAVIQLKKIFNEEVISKDYTVEQNLGKLNEKIAYIQKQITPNIFSSEIAMRQLLIAKQDVILDKPRNLRDVYTFLNKLQIQRGAPFEIIDGDNLDMPLEHIKESLNHVSGKVCVISILGPQSSGKSTVLNFLFGCNFKASEGRCTKGVYGSYYALNNSESSSGYNGLLIIDTEGINSQSKSKQFDRQLVSFIMSITDILLITMKGDLDKAIGDLLIFCLQNSKKRFSNNQMKSMLVLNQNNSNDITKNNIEINQFKSKIKLHHQVQLSRAFNNLTLNSSNLPFLNDKINFMKFTPKPQFMEEIISLQKQIILTMNVGFHNQFLTIDEKMENFSKNWEIVKSFSSIYNYGSNEQIELSNQMDRWIVQKTNQLQKIQENLLQQFKRKNKNEKYIQQKEQQERKKMKEDCVLKMTTQTERILNLLKDEEPKVILIKRAELEAFIKDNLTKKHFNIIDEYQNIFDKKVSLIEQEQVVLNVEEQGIIKINSKAYELRNQQLQNGQKSQLELQNIFETVWKNAEQDLQKNLNSSKNLFNILDLMKDEYNIEIKKFQPEGQNQNDNKPNSKLKQLPALISSISQENILDPKKILSEIQKILQKKKINLLERSNQDPIIIYQKGIGKTTAQKKYLNIEKSYLAYKKVTLKIGVSKEIIKKILTKELEKQLIYKRLLEHINQQLKKHGISVRSHKNLQTVIQYEQKNFIIKGVKDMIGKAPMLQLNFFDSSDTNLNENNKYIITSSIQRIIRQKKNVPGQDLLNLKAINKYLEDGGEILEIYDGFIKEQFNKIGLKIQVDNKQISIFSDPKEYKSVDQFQKKMKTVDSFAGEIQQYLKITQYLGENENYILGYCTIEKQIIDPTKNLPKPIIDYFQVYISADNKQKISMILNKSLSVSDHMNFFTKILEQITNHYQEILKKSEPEKRKEDIVNKIYEEFRKFDQDFRQMSLKSTPVFKGYCHLYAVYLLLSTRMETQKKEKENVIKKYKALKNQQKIQFMNRASTSQQKFSKQAYLNMKDEILKYFKQRVQSFAGQTIKNFDITQLTEVKQKEHKLKIQQLLKEVENSLNRNNKAQVINYTVNKYPKLEQLVKKNLDLKVQFYQIGTINKYVNSFSSSVMNVSSAIQNIVEVFNKIFVKVSISDKNYYDEKNIFEGKKTKSTSKRLADYFMTILQLAIQKDLTQKLIIYEQKEGIKKQMRIRIAPLLLSPVHQYEYKQLFSKMKAKQIQISNLFYFLEQNQQKQDKQKHISAILTLSEEEVKQNMKKQMKKKYRNLINFELCNSKQLCPCCSQICFQQGNHAIHRASYHQVRGWGGTVVTLNNKIDNDSYLSTLVCEDLNEADKMLINNKIQTWSNYKEEKKKHWQLPSRSDINSQIRKEALKLWNDYGQSFANDTQKKFRKSEEKLKYHIIFIIDQSGSMHYQWSKVCNIYDTFVQKIKDSKTENNLNVNNCIVSTILFSNTARTLYQFAEVNKIGNLPNLIGQGTYYMNAFKNMENVLFRSLIKEYSTTTFFLTDGEAMDPDQVKGYIGQLNSLINKHEMKFVSMFFSHSSRFEGSLFESNFKSVNGVMKHSNDIAGIDEIIQTEIQSLVPK